jgi:hypothetical protein
MKKNRLLERSVMPVGARAQRDWWKRKSVKSGLQTIRTEAVEENLYQSIVKNARSIVSDFIYSSFAVSLDGLDSISLQAGLLCYVKVACRVIQAFRSSWHGFGFTGTAAFDSRPAYHHRRQNKWKESTVYECAETARHGFYAFG